MPQVLMLGWEFPPLFAGGLGVATYGMVKAMSSRARIRLIIPRGPDSTELKNVSITGLSKITTAEIHVEGLLHHMALADAEVEEIPLTLSPYHHINRYLSHSHIDGFEKLKAGTEVIQDINNIFSDKEVYGNIFQKMSLYAHIANELARDGNFDIIHAHDWITYPSGVKIKRQSGKPLILHVHSLETDRTGESCRNRIYKLEKKAFGHADRIIAVSQYTKNQLVKHYQISPGKIHVVHNGIEPVSGVRAKRKIADRLVVFLGRLTHQKGPQFLIETAEKVLKVFPRVKFVVAGTGDQFGPLLEASAYKKLGSKFIFTGFLSKAKVNQLLLMADVYFMPSVSEPFGLSTLEAAQFDVPSVISRQSGVAEVLKSTLKADFWDTNKYANYIHALLSHDVLRKEMAREANGELGELTWDHAATKILQVYKEVSYN